MLAAVLCTVPTLPAMGTFAACFGDLLGMGRSASVLHESAPPLDEPVNGSAGLPSEMTAALKA